MNGFGCFRRWHGPGHGRASRDKGRARLNAFALPIALAKKNVEPALQVSGCCHNYLVRPGIHAHRNVECPGLNWCTVASDRGAWRRVVGETDYQPREPCIDCSKLLVCKPRQFGIVLMASEFASHGGIVLGRDKVSHARFAVGAV
jgi:hypothetical protein